MQKRAIALYPMTDHNSQWIEPYLPTSLFTFQIPKAGKSCWQLCNGILAKSSHIAV